MFCKTNNACGGWIILIVALALLLFKPAESLMQKPANEDASYTQGWSDGCRSGIAASSPFSAFSNQPFVQQNVTKIQKSADVYRSAWNDGFTLCRFSQSSFQQWGQFFLLLGTLFFIRCRCGKSSN